MTGTVLVVDDERNIAALTCDVVEKAFPGLSARLVDSGEGCLAYLQGTGDFSDRAKFPYPVAVLLDLKMPGVDGFDVLAWMRDNPPHHRVPVIVLTATTDAAMAKRAYGLGARSFLHKPFQAADLVNAFKGLQT